MILNKENLPNILTVKQVANYLRLSKTAISRWVKEGYIKPVKTVTKGNGVYRYFKKKDLLNYVEDALEY